MINVFEDTIAKVVALAVLMPIVASMGGIAGTQTLTLVIRGRALGQIGRSNLFWLLNRELVVALLNGLMWALVVAVSAALAFQDLTLGGVIAVAVILNMLIAALSGHAAAGDSGAAADRSRHRRRRDPHHHYRRSRVLSVSGPGDPAVRLKPARPDQAPATVICSSSRLPLQILPR